MGTEREKERRLAVFHSFFDDWRVCVRFSDEFSQIASDSPPVISETLVSPPVIQRRGRSANKRENRFSSRFRQQLLERFSGSRFRQPFQAAVLESRFCIDGKSGFGQSCGNRKESRCLLLATSCPRPMRHVADMWISPAYKAFCGTGGKTRV